MRRTLTLAPLLVAGCFSPTWRALAPGTVPERDTVVLVGRLALVPPLGLDAAPRPGEILRPDEVRQVVVLFTSDLSEPFDGRGDRMPLERAWSAWVPVDTWFFIEVPRRAPLYLRGVISPTGMASTAVEAAARLPLAAGDRVAYVGDLTAVRSDPWRLSCRNRMEDARRAAAALGHGVLLADTWASRIAEPISADRTPRPRGSR